MFSKEHADGSLSVPSLLLCVCLLQLDSANRSCTVKVWQGTHLVGVGINFPSHYPNGAAPSFMFHQSTALSTSSQQELHRVSPPLIVAMLTFIMANDSHLGREEVIFVMYSDSCLHNVSSCHYHGFHGESRRL